MGCKTPCARIDSASSWSASSANSMRGCLGLGTMRSSGISRTRSPATSGAAKPSACAVASAPGASGASVGPGAPGMSAPRPRPSAFLVMVDDLLRECAVTGCTAGCSIVVHARLSEARSLAEAHVAGNHGAIHAVREKLPGLVGDLLRQVHAGVEHREQDALDAEAGVQVLLDELDRPHELGQTFE